MDLPNKSDQQPEKPARKKVEPIIPAGAVKAARPATRRFLDFAFAESPKHLAAKIGRDVVVPRLKAGFEEAANSFLSGMLWGSGGRPMSNIVQGAVLRGGGTNYNKISTLPSAAGQALAVSTQKSVGDYQDIIFPTQEFAERVLAGMFDLFNQYRVVTVADLYEMCRITPSTADGAYGWLSLDGARITKDRDGYRLEFPRPSIVT